MLDYFVKKFVFVAYYFGIQLYKREKYKIENANSERPLNGHIYCSECGSKMVGYEVKKKKLHYYKCLKCSSYC